MWATEYFKLASNFGELAAAGLGSALGAGFGGVDHTVQPEVNEGGPKLTPFSFTDFAKGVDASAPVPYAAPTIPSAAQADYADRLNAAPLVTSDGIPADVANYMHYAKIPMHIANGDIAGLAVHNMNGTGPLPAPSLFQRGLDLARANPGLTAAAAGAGAAGIGAGAYGASRMFGGDKQKHAKFLAEKLAFWSGASLGLMGIPHAMGQRAAVRESDRELNDSEYDRAVGGFGNATASVPRANLEALGGALGGALLGGAAGYGLGSLAPNDDAANTLGAIGLGAGGAVGALGGAAHGAYVSGKNVTRDNIEHIDNGTTFLNRHPGQVAVGGALQALNTVSSMGLNIPIGIALGAIGHAGSSMIGRAHADRPTRFGYDYVEDRYAQPTKDEQKHAIAARQKQANFLAEKLAALGLVRPLPAHAYAAPGANILPNADKGLKVLKPSIPTPGEFNKFVASTAK